MQKFVLLAVLLPLLSSAQKKGDTFKITGDLKKLNTGIEWVYFQYLVDGEWKTDSTKPNKGKYFFKGRVAEPMIGRLRVKYSPGNIGKIAPVNFKKDMASIFLEKGKIKVISTDSFSNVKVIGSTAHNEYIKLNEAVKPFNEKLESLYPKYNEYRKSKDEDNIKKSEDEIDAVRIARDEVVYADYSRRNPGSPLALYAVRQYAGWDIDPEKVEPLLNSLPIATQNWPSGVELRRQIEIARNTGIGSIAMDFTQNDTLEKPVSLSSFRGRYLLIDFWASWCGPCRVENPHVVKAFHKYREKGFFILGISLDRPGQKAKWIKAIHDDHLEWTHVSDLKFWNNEVAKQYGIRAIPSNLLLDPEGKIIAKNLRGEELDRTLEEFIIEGRKAF